MRLVLFRDTKSSPFDATYEPPMGQVLERSFTRKQIGKALGGNWQAGISR